MEEFVTEHYDRFNVLFNSLVWQYGSNRGDLACRLCEIAGSLTCEADSVEREYLYLRAIELFEQMVDPTYPFVFATIESYAHQLKENYLQAQAALSIKASASLPGGRRRRAA